MADRRRHKRTRKRMQVKFGGDDLESGGVLTDISISGAFIECRNPPPIGTLLHVHVLDRERDFYVEGVVRRLKRVDPKLRRIEPEGWGSAS